MFDRMFSRGCSEGFGSDEMCDERNSVSSSEREKQYFNKITSTKQLKWGWNGDLKN